MMSECVHAPDGEVGDRCRAAKLDEASDLRGALSNGATTVGAGGASEKQRTGEASGEAEAAASRGKRPRADKKRQKSGKQKKAEKKQRTEQQ